MPTTNIRKRIIISLLPGLLLIVFEAFSSLGSATNYVDYFFVLPCFFLFYILGIKLCFSFARRIKPKIFCYKSLLGLVLTICLLLLFPFILSMVNSLKMDYYLYRNNAELEQVAGFVNNTTWTIEDANLYLTNKGFDIQVVDFQPESLIVLFNFGENSYKDGIAYSKARMKYKSPRLILWEEIQAHWYEWEID